MDSPHLSAPPRPREDAIRQGDTCARERAREALIWIERRFGLTRAELPFLWGSTEPLEAREPGTSAGRGGKGESK